MVDDQDVTQWPIALENSRREAQSAPGQGAPEPAALATARKAISRVVDVDMGLVDDEMLDGLIEELAIAHDRLQLAMSFVLGEWVGRGVWSRDGSRSPAHRLARLTGRSLTSCRDDLVRARRVGLLPAACAAVAEGAISMDVLDLLVQAAIPSRHDVMEQHEAGLVGAIRGMPFTKARTAVRYWAQRVDDELDEVHSDARTDSVADGVVAADRVYMSTTLDDVVVLDASLDAVSGAIVSNELDRLVTQIASSDRSSGVSRSPAARRAAALVEMATRSAAAPEGGRRPAPLFTVVIGAESFDRLCELSNGRVLSPSELVPYLDRSVVQSVLFDGPSTVISVSARRRFVGAVRRAIEVRDRHCQHTRTDCEVRAEQCDVDHIVAWSQGGETSQFNGRLQCPTHNRRPERHDPEARPLPSRTVTRLDEIRCRLRWQHQHEVDTDDAAVSCGPDTG
ncbi:MAG: hypothetical protein RI958_1977 [Actinomycetota bacterium]